MKRKYLTITLVLLTVSISVIAQKSFEVTVRSNDSIDTNGITIPEIVNSAGEIFNVSKSTITVYPANKTKNTGMAVLICPGGGYTKIDAKNEGSDFAEWLSENGITGIVLKYRLPNHHPQIPLEDAKKAMQVIRERASSWKVDPQKIGVMGFAAGGHLASTLLTHFDSISRPNFGILCYPLITFTPRLTHSVTMYNFFGNKRGNDIVNYYSNEKQVKLDTPPTLMLHSNYDKSVSPQNTMLFYRALKAQKIFASVQMFPSATHGWGFNSTYPYHESMKESVLDWILLFK